MDAVIQFFLIVLAVSILIISLSIAKFLNVMSKPKATYFAPRDIEEDKKLI